MKRPYKAFLAVAGVAGVCAAPALADVVELGTTSRAPLVAPTCPPSVSSANCTIILTQVTALETIRDNVAYPTTVTKPGYIAAFTLGLSRLNSDLTQARLAVHYLDTRYGGTAQAAITVLKPVGKKARRQFRVVAQSPIVHLLPYLGEVAQFPLTTPIPVTPGEVIALSVPTWAPVLSFNLPQRRYAYRQSRTKNCANPPGSSQAQLAVGDTARYVCDYPGTRVEYSATEITSPVPAKIQVTPCSSPPTSTTTTTTTTTTTSTRTTTTRARTARTTARSTSTSTTSSGSCS